MKFYQAFCSFQIFFRYNWTERCYQFVGEHGIFGVPLSLAVSRMGCHDGVPLPLVVRQCIDCINEKGIILSVMDVFRGSIVSYVKAKCRSIPSHLRIGRGRDTPSFCAESESRQTGRSSKFEALPSFRWRSRRFRFAEAFLAPAAGTHPYRWEAARFWENRSKYIFVFLSFDTLNANFWFIGQLHQSFGRNISVLHIWTILSHM